MESNLKALTENKRTQLLNSFRYDITRLYWDIGRDINEGLKHENAMAKAKGARTVNEKVLAQDNILVEVAEKITPVFGELLNADNLQKMQVLNKQYKIKNLLDQDLFDVPHKLADYFNKKSGSRFRKLIEPTLDFSPELEEIITDNPFAREIIFHVYRRVMLFQLLLNQFVYLDFNNLYWETGVELLKVTQGSVNDERGSKAVVGSQSSLPFPLTEKELPHCMEFARIYANNWKQGNLTHHIPWEYIKELIKVGNMEDQMRITNQIVLFHIPLSELKKLLKKNSFNPENGLDVSNRDLPARPQIIRTVALTQNGSILTSEVNRWPGFYNKLHHNIYANNTLLKFLKGKK